MLEAVFKSDILNAPLLIIIQAKSYCTPKYGFAERFVVQIESNNQRTIGPENAHLKPDPGVHVLSHHLEMTLTLNTHTPLLNS